MCLIRDLHFTLLYVVVSQQFDKTTCVSAHNHDFRNHSYRCQTASACNYPSENILIWGQPDYYNQKQYKVLSLNMEKMDFLAPCAPTSFSSARLTWTIARVPWQWKDYQLSRWHHRGVMSAGSWNWCLKLNTTRLFPLSKTECGTMYKGLSTRLRVKRQTSPV